MDHLKKYDLSEQLVNVLGGLGLIGAGFAIVTADIVTEKTG